MSDDIAEAKAKEEEVDFFAELEKTLDPEEKDDEEGIFRRMESFHESSGSRRKNNIDARRQHVRKSVKLEIVQVEVKEEKEDLTGLEDSPQTFMVYKRGQNGQNEFKLVIDYLKDLCFWRF